MDRMRVYVIIDLDKYSQKEIQEELKTEGYQHNFLFGNAEFGDIEIKKQAIQSSNEVWCFGDCTYVEDYRFAKKFGCDIWVMK